MGMYALAANTTGASNVAIGYQALTANTTANNNTAVGIDSLKANTTGPSNTAVGLQALQANTTGRDNTSIGESAGYTTTTGNYNTFLGTSSRGDSATSGNEIVIGYNVQGVGGGYATLGYGGTKSYINSGYTSWTGTSDSRLKDNITTSTAGLSFINDLRPITFEWKVKGDVPSELNYYEEGSTVRVNGTDKVQHGFLAQEIKATIDAHPEIKSGHGMWMEQGDGTQGVAQGQLVPMLVKAIQELSTQNAALAARLTALEA